MANTEKEGTIAELLALLKDKDDEIARLKLLIGTGGPPVSNAHYLSRVKSVCCFASPTSRSVYSVQVNCAFCCHFQLNSVIWAAGGDNIRELEAQHLRIEVCGLGLRVQHQALMSIDSH